MRFTRLIVVALCVLPWVACAARGRVFTIGNGVTAPVVIRQVNPQYTPQALTSRITGSVLLRCVVRENGTVSDVQIVRSLDRVAGLDTQAIEAVKQWSFRPGTRNGKPVAVRVSVDMNFTLE
jgi:protein TonB